MRLTQQRRRRRDFQTAKEELDERNATLRRVVPVLSANLHLARRQMSAQPELPPLCKSQPGFYGGLPPPSAPRPALLFYSNFISRNNKERPSSSSRRESTLDIRRAEWGDSGSVQGEASGDFDNDHCNENKHGVSSGMRHLVVDDGDERSIITVDYRLLNAECEL